MSGFHRGGYFRLLTLTSSPAAADFQRDFRRLYMRLKRKGVRFEYIRVAEYTRSGLRHEHILYRGDYIGQRWISALWSALHQSPIVDIRRVGGTKRVAGYLAKYLAKEAAGRLSWAFSWVWQGFVGDWKWLLRVWRIKCGAEAPDFSEVLNVWRYCLFWKIRPQRLDSLRYVAVDWGML